MNVEDLVEGFIDEAKMDFISLDAIASDVKVDLKINDPREIMKKSIQIVKALMEVAYSLETTRWKA